MPEAGTKIRSIEVQGRRARTVTFVADAEARARIGKVLGLIALDRLELRGVLSPEGREDLRLEARLSARAAQPCVVTLAPVWTEPEAEVLRRFVARPPEPPPGEIEMPEDDTIEPMPEVIDLAEIATEALALALPDYPRAEGASLGEAVFGPPGSEPLRQADLRHFAALKVLKRDAPPDGQTGGDA
jgi:uncharacterized metal-binding protein YceD (DUF177 family)